MTGLALEITPIDIRYIRQGLGLSQKRMGECLAEYLHGPGSSPIPGSRINEWEMHVRAIPDHVFVACAGVLIETWANVRAGKSADEVRRVDPKFARLLSPAFASVISLEDEYRDRKDREGGQIYRKTQQVRQELQTYLESLLFISMSKIDFRRQSEGEPRR
jgi:hypothetical protein